MFKSLTKKDGLPKTKQKKAWNESQRTGYILKSLKKEVKKQRSDVKN